MPVVVTTSVQFFESLFANKGSRCRKLHNIVNSVIVLDEAQLIPVEYMKPCLWALAELVLNYKATVVFCTATQPVVKPVLPKEIDIVEIMEDPGALQELFKRTNVRYAGYMSDEQVTAAMAVQSQVLTIVNTRRHARLLFDRLQQKAAEGNYHLSARMCPEHRKAILRKIKDRLAAGEVCRVVATQLIEAGVDVDFPVVYRAEAGIDSIAQAAGRCNREGRCPAGGEVIVFAPEQHGMPSRGRFRKVADIARSVLQRQEKNGAELLSPQAIEQYFAQLMDVERDILDVNEILKLTSQGGAEVAFPFAEIAKKFQFIDGEMLAVVVPYNEKAEELIQAVEYYADLAGGVRKLQPYVVQVYRHEMTALEKAGAVKLAGGSIPYVTDRSFYDECFGLKDGPEVKVSTGILVF